MSPGTTVRQQGTTDVRQMYDSYDSYDSTTVRQLRQLYDSDHVCQLSYPPTTATTATTGLRQMYVTATTAPLQGWLNLIGMPLVEVHPSRKVSLDKCSHQGVAHWHQYTRCTVIPPSRGDLFRKASALLSDGVPPTHWVVHQGWYHIIG